MRSTKTTPLPPKEVVAIAIAQWQGMLSLGDNGIECYVLGDGTRVIGLTSAVRATEGGTAGGNILAVAGIAGLREHLDYEGMMSDLVEFEIPGMALRNGKGLSTEWFERLLTAYVDAALDPSVVLTPKQRETARRCQVLQRGLIRTGLDALVDEATGYQNIRAEDALQIKLKAFIADELRGWEKTFPDELWMEFGRLSNWKDPLKNRPQWWGKLVVWLIYDTLDPDVARFLRENRPPANVRWHQQLSENIGVQALVSRCHQVIGIAKMSSDLADLRDKVALHYGTKPLQLGFLEDMRAPKLKIAKSKGPRPVGQFQGLPPLLSQDDVTPVIPGLLGDPSGMVH
jgi:hypothetical protein